MHCPQCGYRQNLDKARFCTKCGLDISDVKALLASNLAETKTKRKNDRRKATKQGFFMIIFGLALVMILGALREYYPIPKIVIMLPLLIFMLGGVLRMAMSVLSDSSDDEEDIDKFIEDLDASISSGRRTSAKILPEADEQTAKDQFGKNYDTGDLVQPLSVTEHTTRKLKKEFEQ